MDHVFPAPPLMSGTLERLETDDARRNGTERGHIVVALVTNAARKLSRGRPGI